MHLLRPLLLAFSLAAVLPSLAHAQQHPAPAGASQRLVGKRVYVSMLQSTSANPYMWINGPLVAADASGIYVSADSGGTEGVRDEKFEPVLEVFIPWSSIKWIAAERPTPAKK